METRKQVIRLTESDLHNIIRGTVNRILGENVDEGWKDWAMAGALGAASIFGNPQTTNAQNAAPTEVIQQSRFTPKDVKKINMQIDILQSEAKISNESQIEELTKQRDYMVSTFSKSEKTINFGEDKNSVLSKLDICGWWNKQGTSFSEEGQIEKINFDAFSIMYVGEYELDKGQEYTLIFNNGKLKNIDTSKTYGDKINNRIDQLKNMYDNINRGVGLTQSPKKEKNKQKKNYDDIYLH